MRTTNKCFKEQIQKHIIEGLSTDYSEVLKEQLQNVNDSFHNWYGPYEQRRTPNLQEAFVEWMGGLPSELGNEYTDSGIHATLKSWWENCGETYREQDSDKEAHLYSALFYREFKALCKKEGI